MATGRASKDNETWAQDEQCECTLAFFAEPEGWSFPSNATL